MRPNPLSLRHRFASNLRRIRNQQGISQEVLGERAGLHRTYIGSVERGERNVSIDSIERIASSLGVEITELFRVQPIKVSK
ncbi:MAG TPA: helix-turn-helix transcriptional regulator [Pirellulales bacterium]|nr:helix-turn-helix transcriptional regulator [Pirellulales bacterium]